jgi:hypothetical protein
MDGGESQGCADLDGTQNSRGKGLKITMLEEGRDDHASVEEKSQELL